jgi:predicted ribosome quality control (RQC) complex YloA/Tae2 family protein
LKEEVDSLLTLERAVAEIEELDKLRELLPEFDKKGESRKFSLRSFTLPSGRKLLVGRSSSENELISLKLSNPWDYWFHAKGIPGSHVVLKLPKGEEPTEDELLLAASAAAYFSKGRSSGKVLVDYTQAKNLKKPPGTPKGFVTYTGEKTLVVRPETFERFLKPSEEKAP